MGEAGLKFDPLNVADIREKWLNLYFDHDLRTHLASRGKERAGRYCWEAAGRLLWGEIEQTASSGQQKERWAG